MYNKFFRFISVFLPAVFLLSLPAINFAAAQGVTNGNGTQIFTPNISGLTDADLGIQYGAATGLTNQDPRVIAARIIRTSMQVLGILAVIIIVIGGFTWMTAGGNEEKVGEAKKWIFAGIIGLTIILLAYSIATFVISQLVTVTTS